MKNDDMSKFLDSNRGWIKNAGIDTYFFIGFRPDSTDERPAWFQNFAGNPQKSILLLAAFIADNPEMFEAAQAMSKIIGGSR